MKWIFAINKLYLIIYKLIVIRFYLNNISSHRKLKFLHND